jgi:hypothetical protein
MNAHSGILYENFGNGVNLGGWLSQFDIDCPAPFTAGERAEHFRTFITKADIERIATWGFDHVRLPVDGIALTSAGPGGPLDADMLETIDRCLDWCAEQRLNVVLDLHDFHGNEWGQMTRLIPLLSDERLTDFFCGTWLQLVHHLKGRTRPLVMVELLNEVSDASGRRWNELVGRVTDEIRAVDPTRWILVGSNGQNAVNFLPELRLPPDPHVFATFHYYEPQAFTHQRARFSEEHRDFNQAISYPGELTGFQDFLAKRPEFQSKHRLILNETRSDKDLMERLLSDAAVYAASSTTGLYCGEYGVIDSAAPADAARWIADFSDWTRANRVGRALWTYKERDFGLVRRDGSVHAPEILDALGLKR